MCTQKTKVNIWNLPGIWLGSVGHNKASDKVSGILVTFAGNNHSPRYWKPKRVSSVKGMALKLANSKLKHKMLPEYNHFDQNSETFILPEISLLSHLRFFHEK